MLPPSSRIAGVIIFCLLLPGLAGCGKDSPAKPAAVITPDLSPAGVVRLYEKGMSDRDPALLDSLFTADYRFHFAAGDSAGLSDPVWRQPDEAAGNYAMLHGTPTVTPLQRVVMNFDTHLIPFPDNRLGRDPRFHKTIRTTMSLHAEPGDGGSYEITGFLLFSLVRGDSAQILPGHGAADSTRWWIQSIVDETIPPSGFRSLPSRSFTYGWLKQLYRSYLRLPS